MICSVLIVIFSITSSQSFHHYQHHNLLPPLSTHPLSNSTKKVETHFFDDSKRYVFVSGHNAKYNVKRMNRIERLNFIKKPFNVVNLSFEKKCKNKKMNVARFKSNFLITQKISKNHIEERESPMRDTSIRESTTDASIRTRKRKLENINRHALSNDDQKRVREEEEEKKKTKKKEKKKKKKQEEKMRKEKKKKKRNSDTKMDSLQVDIEDASKISKVEERGPSRLVGVNGRHGLQIASRSYLLKIMSYLIYFVHFF